MKKNIKYCPAPDLEKTSFSFDHVHIEWDKQLTFHQQETWELSYVITGRGVRIIGDMIEPFSQGEVILIPPNIPHGWSFDESVHDHEGKIENITIVFTNEFLERSKTVFPELADIVSNVCAIRNAVSFKGETQILLQGIMMAMVAETYVARIGSFIKLLSLVASTEMVNVVGYPVEEDKHTKKIQSIYLYVMNNYQYDITLDEVARHVNMEKTSFCVFFKKMTKRTFFSFLLEYRIESSCQMLLKTSKTIAEICILSGFRDVPYYNRIFKKIKQMTPTVYRKLAQPV